MFEKLAASLLTQKKFEKMTPLSQRFANKIARSSQQAVSDAITSQRAVSDAITSQQAVSALSTHQVQDSIAHDALESLQPQMRGIQRGALYDLQQVMHRYQNMGEQMAAALDTERLTSNLFDPYPAPGSLARSGGAPSPSGNRSTIQVDRTPVEWGYTQGVIFWISVSAYWVNREIEQQGLDEAFDLGERLERILRLAFYLHYFFGSFEP